MLICGVDEVGRGPLAGPVVAAAVVFKKGYRNKAIKDSKKLCAKVREELVDIIKAQCVQWSVVAVGHRRIDAWNIRQATRVAMSLAVRRVTADLVLIDGNMAIDTRLKQRTIVKGDSSRVEIGAASIIAKVYRDALMRSLDAKYCGYGFDHHAGYATQEHRDAIARLGPSRIHRRSFCGVIIQEDMQVDLPFLSSEGQSELAETMEALEEELA